MQFKVTEKVLDLVYQLFAEGYAGTTELTDQHATGTRGVLGNCYALKLSGFCKETLQIAENTEDHQVYMVGRYHTEKTLDTPTVKDIVDIAWECYGHYRDRGYSRPYEFEKLFLKYGYLQAKTETITRLIEQ